MKREATVVRRLPGRLSLVVSVLVVVLVAVTVATVAMPPQASAAVTWELRSDERMWLDSNKPDTDGMRAAFLCWRLYNDSTTETLYDVTVTFSGFDNLRDPDGVSVTPPATYPPALFADPTDDVQQYNSLGPGEYLTVCFYVDYDAVAQYGATIGNKKVWFGWKADYTITLDAATTPGGTPTEQYSTGTRTVTSASTVSAAAGAEEISSLLGPGIYVGQVLEQTVNYTVGNNDYMQFQPIGISGFRDDVFRLIGNEVTGIWGYSISPDKSPTNISVGDTDRFYWPTSLNPASGTTFQITYYWEVLSSGISSFTMPWGLGDSGTLYKALVAGQAELPAADPAPLEVTKTVDPTYMETGSELTAYGTGTVKYTVDFTNTATSDYVPITLSQILDELPYAPEDPDDVYMVNSTYTGSEVTTGNSSAYPLADEVKDVIWKGTSSRSRTVAVPLEPITTSGQTRIWTDTGEASNFAVRGAAGTLVATGATTTITETQVDGPWPWSMVGVAIVPASAGSLSAAASTSGSTTGATSLAVSHTTVSPANLMLVSVTIGDDADGVEADVTDVTYGGQSMTPIVVTETTPAAHFRARTVIYALANPTVGTADVTATINESLPFAVGVTTFNGANVTSLLNSALRTPVRTSGIGRVMTATVTSVAGDLVYEAVTIRGGKTFVNGEYRILPGETLTLVYTARVDADAALGVYVNDVYGKVGLEATEHATAYFKIGGTPTLAVISDFDAYEVSNGAAVVWETVSEIGTVGYYIERLDENSDKYKRVQNSPVPALLESSTGGRYSLIDHGAHVGETYTYRVVELEIDGSEIIHGPYQVTVDEVQQDLEIARELIRGQGIARIPDLPAQASTQAQNARGKGLTKKAGATLIRIEVADSGLYEIEASDIASGLGLSTQQAARLIKNAGLSLTSADKTVAYLPAVDGSGLYFYGEAIDSLFAARNVYWLTQGKGVVMSGARPVNVRKTMTTITEFVDTVHAEENMFTYPQLTDDPGTDIWVWTYVFTGMPQTLSVNTPAATEGAELDVTLWGLIDIPHNVGIQLNGVKLGEVEWDGSAQTTVTLTIPEGVLLAGSNQVTLTAEVGSSNPYNFDAVIVDCLDVIYSRTTMVGTGTLLMEAPTKAPVKVAGIAADNALILDLTNPLRPQTVECADDSGDGTAGLLFDAEEGREYYVTSVDELLEPAAMTATVEPTLTDTGRGAKYVVITAPALLEAAERFAAYRESQGLETAVVTTSEIYDEFNYGIADPAAIQSFIKLIVTKWKPETEYVLLAGEGSLDYKDYLGHGDCLVPSLLIDGNGCIVPSDSALADVLGNDGLSEVAIGRVPAQTVDELDAFLAKVKAYEAASGDWQQSILLSTDNPDIGGDFYAHSDAIGEGLPTSLNIAKAYLGEMSLAETRASIKAAFVDQSLLISYVGHASSGQLASEALLTKGTVASLPARSGLPILTAYSCLAGYFGVPGYDGLAESLVNKAGAGSIGVWAPGGMEMSTDSAILGALFSQELFDSSHEVVLGDAIQAAKAEAKKDGLSSATLQDYGLLGDPALRITW